MLGKVNQVRLPISFLLAIASQFFLTRRLGIYAYEYPHYPYLTTLHLLYLSLSYAQKKEERGLTVHGAGKVYC